MDVWKGKEIHGYGIRHGFDGNEFVVSGLSDVIIPACAHFMTLPIGQQLHGYMIRSHFDDNMFIGSSLVNMYAKCGNIKLAKLIFDSMKQQDLVSWTAMIMGCALHGESIMVGVLGEQERVINLGFARGWSWPKGIKAGGVIGFCLFVWVV
ncbi:tetratricopeptide repeat (TPR)-like superfamily protein [Artemisia annua]|uniref:Tetratricopeptide repeat (TPR)-like superfamily protein n=1 Tax=Artemisia annua TaxID=35608 RepID=A0A2U1NKE1_ARTAN|nr:tetratricopeptide repeat (TPR)-like superfamily protein [Artemisia annua]